MPTKKDLEQLATKNALLKLDLKVTGQTGTLTRTTALVTNIREDLKEFREELAPVPGTLDSHTTTLDSVFKNTEHWKTESMSLKAALKRHEDWIGDLAEKLGVSLKGLQRDKTA